MEKVKLLSEIQKKKNELVKINCILTLVQLKYLIINIFNKRNKINRKW